MRRAVAKKEISDMHNQIGIEVVGHSRKRITKESANTDFWKLTNFYEFSRFTFGNLTFYRLV